jgi:hypothetical protein
LFATFQLLLACSRLRRGLSGCSLTPMCAGEYRAHCATVTRPGDSFWQSETGCGT